MQVLYIYKNKQFLVACSSRDGKQERPMQGRQPLACQHEASNSELYLVFYLGNYCTFFMYVRIFQLPKIYVYACTYTQIHN